MVQNTTVNGYFKGSACTEFAAGVRLYTEFTELMARAIMCLKLSVTNTLDVFVAFAATNTALDKKLCNSTLLAYDLAFIHSKAKFCFSQHINKNTHGIYVLVFVVDPHWYSSACLRIITE
jgi:hypothetical protein